MSNKILNGLKLLICILALTFKGASYGQNIYLFDDPIYYNSGSGPIETVSTDVNSDGYLDLVVVNYSSSNISVLLNNGNGTFQDQNTSPVMSLPKGIKVSDFNNDSFPDIVTTCSGSNVISYLQNNGNGVFSASVNSPTQLEPWGIDSYDFNSDGYLDIAVANSGSNSIQVLLNNQDGTFTASFSASSGEGTKFLSIGDLDGDSYPEIVITRSFVNYIFVNGFLTVFENNGDGTYTKYIDDYFGSSVSDIYIYDFNGDNHNDIITNTLRNNSYKMCFFINDGQGNYGNPETTFAGYQGRFTMNDFDNNGFMDFAVSENQYNATGLAIVLNNGNFNFDPVFSFYMGDQPRRPANGDFDLDGDIDLAVPIYDEGKVAIIMNTLNPVPVELVSFTASAGKNSITLSWQTATETNNYGFEIQRLEQSISNKWNRIEFVEGHGTTTAENNYSFVDENLTGGKYQYRLKQIDYDGSFEFSEIIEIELSTPIEFSLEQNYPNPFNPTTTIKYSIPESGIITISIYNALGEKVKTILDEFKEAGTFEITFNADDLGGGVYYYRLIANDFSEVKKMILLK